MRTLRRRSGQARRYAVKYERDESGWWIASVPSVKGCHTQGRTIEEARRRIREALGLFVDHANRAMLLDRIEMPADVRRALESYRKLSSKATETERHASDAARKAVRLLGTRLRVSTRDAGTLLGLSHQRVHQLRQRSTAADRRRTRRR